MSISFYSIHCGNQKVYQENNKSKNKIIATWFGMNNLVQMLCCCLFLYPLEIWEKQRTYGFLLSSGGNGKRPSAWND